MTRKVTRRALLKGLGASAAMIPLLQSERTLAAAGAIKRFITVTWPNGVIQSDFYPTSPTLGTFGKTLAALQPFASKVLIPKGLNLQVVLDAMPDRTYDGHFTYPSLLTGTAQQKAEGRIGQGPSIDVAIQSSLAMAGYKAPALHLGVVSNGRDGNPTTWQAAAQPILPEVNPAVVFKSLFATPMMSGPAIDNTLLRRKSVLDFLTADLQGFTTRLGTDDRAKIDAHMTGIRELENLLTNAPPSVVAGGNCQIPTTAPVLGKDTPTQMQAMFDLAAIAIQCDAARVITMDLYDDGGADGNSFPWLNINDDYHKVAHAGSSGAASKTTIDGWIYKNVASMLAKLDASQEGAVTALDNTVVLVSNDMEDGASHYVGRIPFLMVGSCGGYFKTGRLVDLGKEPHNKLLTTICNAMGMNVTSYGDPKYAGTLPTLLM